MYKLFDGNVVTGEFQKIQDAVNAAHYVTGIAKPDICWLALSVQDFLPDSAALINRNNGWGVWMETKGEDVLIFVTNNVINIEFVAGKEGFGGK